MELFIPFVLTPSLRAVTVLGYTPAPDTLFPLVASLAPYTERLMVVICPGAHIWSNEESEGTTGTLPLHHLPSLTQLRSLDVITSLTCNWGVEMSSIYQNLLIQMPHLNKLSVAVHRVVNDGPSLPMSSNNASAIVSPLDTFDLCYSPKRSGDLPQLCSLPFVTGLIVRLNSCTATPTEVATFISLVSSSPTLTGINIYGTGMDERLTIDVEDVVSLFASRTLKRIALECIVFTHRVTNVADAPLPLPSSSTTLPTLTPSSNTIFDMIINAMKSNPSSSLENLSLVHNVYPAELNTFSSLGKIAQHAPWLKELSVDLTLPPSALRQSSHIHTVSQLDAATLKSLSILAGCEWTHPDPSDYPFFAQQIDTWFPNLNVLHFYLEDGADRVEINEVRTTLKNSRLSGGTLGGA
jgi:hypothetical protein